MILETIEQDSLNLSLTKEHLVIDNIDFDLLIQHYINASLAAVDNYTHLSTLSKVYVNTAQEIEAYTPLKTYEFSIEYRPYKVEVNGVALKPDDYKYYSSKIIIKEDLVPFGETVKAYIGYTRDISDITQARLLLIGSWFENRENTQALRLSELPDGVKFILNNTSDIAL